MDTMKGDRPGKPRLEPPTHGGRIGNVCQRQFEKAAGGGEAVSVLGMIGTQPLLAQMHKRPGKLDETLEKAGRFPALPQPKMLQRIMCLVIFPAVETPKVGPVLEGKGVIPRQCLLLKKPEALLHAGRFVGGRMGWIHLAVDGVCFSKSKMG